MTKFFKCLLSALIIITVASFPLFSASAETVAENNEHSLSLSLPDGYVLLDLETAEDNVDLIESLGYSLTSFKNYLKADDSSPQNLFLGVEPNTKAQISVKSWSTDFSAKISDFSLLDDASLEKTAKELVTVKGASYKIVSANGMNLIEIRSSTKDSGGDFCSVQYITVCNKNFYSLTFTFSGNIDDAKVETALDTLSTFKIKTDIESSAWDFGSILIMILLGIVVVAAAIVAVIIVYSIIKDIKKRRADATASNDYIRRR